MVSASTFTPLRLLNDSSESQPSCSEVPPVFDEPALFYDPPYANPTHDCLAWNLVKYLDPTCGLRAEVEVAASEVPLRVDLLIEHHDRRMGLVCGSSEDIQARWHDALLMGCGAVDVLYRIQPDDVHNHLHDILWLAARWDPVLFSERGRINLRTLSSPTARDVQPRPIDTIMRLRYDDAPDTAPLPSETCTVQRLSQRHPDGWMPVYERASEALGLNLLSHQQWARSA